MLINRCKTQSTTASQGCEDVFTGVWGYLHRGVGISSQGCGDVFTGVWGYLHRGVGMSSQGREDIFTGV